MRENSMKRGKMMEIRLAFPNEVDAIMQVIEGAKKCLAEAGSTQWQNGYPNTDTIIEDIISGQAYVALEEGELLAAFFPEIGKLCLDNIVFNSTTLRYDKVLFLVKYPNLYN